jgi:hypothetical protein
MSRERKLIAHMPAEFKGHLTACLDRESDLGKAFLERYAEVVRDLGGEEALAATKRSEARDFVALDILIDGMVCDLLARNPIDCGALTGAMNAKSGKARVLGLERKPKRGPSLREVMSGTVSPIKPSGTSP